MTYNCTSFSPRISNLQANQINGTWFRINWESASNSKEFNNLSEIIFNAFNSKNKHKTILPIRLDKEKLKNQYLMVNINITDDGLYILEANFFNNFSCNVLLTTQFLAKGISSIQQEKEYDIFNNKSNVVEGINKEIISNLTVDIVCDKQERALKFNLTWNNTGEYTEPNLYEIEYNSVFNESPFCKGASNFNYKYEGASSVIVPPPNHSSNVLGNCTYGITVRSYKSKLLPVLLYMYTAKLNVPACVDSCCNCSMLKPMISNLSITRINLTKYIVTWENDSNSRNNFTSISFHIKNLDVPVINAGPKSFNENYTLLVINVTTGSFTLVVDYINIYNCEATLSVTFGESPDVDEDNPQFNYEDFSYNYDTYLETTTNRDESDTAEFFVQADQITNLSVDTFCDLEEHTIKFNLTWEKPEGNSPPSQYNFIYQVVSNEVYPCVESQDFIYDDGDENLTQIVIPPQHYIESVMIQGNCTYRISVIALNMYRLHNDEDIFETEVYVPPCVGICCNCEILSPSLENISVVHVEGQLYRVFWSSEKRHKHRNNLTNITFDLKNPEIPLFDVGPGGFTEDFKDIEINVTAGHYTLIADFINNYTCSSSFYLPFEVKEHTTQGNIWMHLMAAFSAVGFVVLILLYFFRNNLVIIKELFFSKFRTREGREQYCTIPTIRMEENPLYVKEEIKDCFEFPRSRLLDIKELDRGAFGTVFLAKMIENNGTCKFVAKKTLREGAPKEEADDFLAEIQILKTIANFGNHPNIVTLLGYCTIEEPHVMIMELVPCGNLQKYLWDLRDYWQTRRGQPMENCDSGSYIEPESPMSVVTTSTRRSNTTQSTNLSEARTPRTPTTPMTDTHFKYEIRRVLDNKELQDFAFQIAKGMAHLESIPITHRDLAARNILINEFKVLKISDFGLSRTGPYINTSFKKLPLRWTSIEAIEEHLYTNKSDVWAFAVVLWEMGTLGGFPYDNVLDGLVLHYLKSGKRLPRPEVCTDDLYSLMLRCWSEDVDLRPSFKELVDLLDANKKKIYVDFSQLNPTYVFPPSTIQHQFRN